MESKILDVLNVLDLDKQSLDLDLDLDLIPLYFNSSNVSMVFEQIIQNWSIYMFKNFQYFFP